jgi:hypothetical protein
MTCELSCLEDEDGSRDLEVIFHFDKLAQLSLWSEVFRALIRSGKRRPTIGDRLQVH